MFILDTDILTLLFEGHPRVLSRRGHVSSAEIATTIITQIEIMRGRFEFLMKAPSGRDLLRAQAACDRTAISLGSVDITIPIDAESAAEFDRLRGHKKLKKIGRADLLIACIALAHRATLVTRNVSDFQEVPGLRVEN